MKPYEIVLAYLEIYFSAENLQNLLELLEPESVLAARYINSQMQPAMLIVSSRIQPFIVIMKLSKLIK